MRIYWSLKLWIQHLLVIISTALIGTFTSAWSPAVDLFFYTNAEQMHNHASTADKNVATLWIFEQSLSDTYKILNYEHVFYLILSVILITTLLIKQELEWTLQLNLFLN